jgi:hypothetical protein
VKSNHQKEPPEERKRFALCWPTSSSIVCRGLRCYIELSCAACPSGTATQTQPAAGARDEAESVCCAFLHTLGRCVVDKMHLAHTASHRKQEKRTNSTARFARTQSRSASHRHTAQSLSSTREPDTTERESACGSYLTTDARNRTRTHTAIAKSLSSPLCTSVRLRFQRPIGLTRQRQARWC